MTGRMITSGLVVLLVLVAGCERKIQSPNGNCGQTPGQCGYSR